MWESRDTNEPLQNTQHLPHALSTAPVFPITVLGTKKQGCWFDDISWHKTQYQGAVIILVCTRLAFAPKWSTTGGVQ
eukprot:458497-Amphidinium_carterae.4